MDHYVRIICTTGLFLILFMTCVNASLQIRIGIISRPCSSTVACINETLLNTADDNINLTSIFYWRYTKGRELYDIAKIVSEFKDKKIDACVLATEHEAKYIEPMFSNKVVTVVGADMIESIRTSLDLPPHTECSLRLKLNTLLCKPPAGFSGKTIPKVIEKPSNHVSDVVASLVKYLKWKTTLFFYESEMGNHIDEITQHLSNFEIITHNYVADNYTIHDFHNVIHKSSNWQQPIPMDIITMCKSTCSTFLEAINTYDSKNPRQRALRHFSEIVVVAISTEVSQFQLNMENSTLDNIVFLSLPTALSYSSLFTSDVSINTGDRQEFEALIQFFMKNAKFTISYKYTDSLSSQILHLVNQLQESKMCKWFPIETLMWTPLGRGFNNVGYIDINGELITVSSLFPNKEFGLNGRHFVVSTVEWSPFVIKLPNGSYDGLSFDIFNEIAGRFNFTYEVITPPRGEWGLQLEDGNWTGSIGQLQRKEIDFMVSSLTVHSAREQVMDFTQPYYYDSTIILMTKQDPLKTKWRTLIEPFDDAVLLCIGCSLMVASILLFIFEKISPYNAIKGGVNERNEFITYQHSLWYMYGALLTQGGDRLPNSFTGRTMLSCWWLFCLVMMATYSGNLIAFLTVSKDKLPFESIAEMIKQDDYKWGVIGGSYWVTIFKRSVLPEFKAVWAGIVRFNASDTSVLSSDPSSHIQKVLDGNYAYLGDKTQLEIKMANTCVLQTGKEEILPFQYAFGLPNNSPFTKMISDELLEIHESGLLLKWKSKRWPKTNVCKGDLKTSAKAITLIDVQSAFYLIGIGVTLAIFVIFIERAIFSWQKRKTKVKEQEEE